MLSFYLLKNRTCGTLRVDNGPVLIISLICYRCLSRIGTWLLPLPIGHRLARAEGISLRFFLCENVVGGGFRLEAAEIVPAGIRADAAETAAGACADLS